MAKASGGSAAQFTYDFGIAIAQGTLNKITRLTGVTLSLASAFYALKTTATEYVSVLRENTLRFGGVLSTMKAMQQAQDRLITGMSRFDVRDQMEGMNKLMAAGVNIKKEMGWIEKAAHATGKSFDQFSGMIASAVQGNLQGLVDAGLMTQRATKAFAKFQGNTVMMQGAVLKFLRSHKGLMAAIRNDYATIGDGIKRLKGVMTSFLTSVIGKPNDPNSLYGSVAKLFNMLADKFGKNGVLTQNMIMLRQYGQGVGIVFGWVVRQVGKLMVWLGRVFKKVTTMLLGSSDTFVERMRSLVVWLEFWKQEIVDRVKSVVKWLGEVYDKIVDFKKSHPILFNIAVAVIALSAAWLLLRKRILWCWTLQKRYYAFQGPALSKFSRAIQSLAAWLPQPFRHAWVAIGKFISKAYIFTVNILSRFKGVFTSLFGVLKNIAKVPFVIFKQTGMGIINWLRNIWAGNFLGALKALFVTPTKNIFIGLGAAIKGIFISGFNTIRALFTALNATNPVGWIILAITAIVILYNKCRTFRVLVNNMFKAWWEYVKLIWNLIYGAFIAVAVFCKRAWGWLNDYIFQPVINFFKNACNWAKRVWNAFKDSTVGRFIDKYIVSPLKNTFEWILKAVQWLLKGAAAILSVINESLAEEIRKGEQELGMSTSLAAGGGNYNLDDDTNYMNPSNWFGNDTDKSTTPANPISDVNTQIPTGGGGTTNNLSFSNGAIQIIVQKGENIDENKLAQMVRVAIKDVNRENNMRGGTI